MRQLRKRRHTGPEQWQYFVNLASFMNNSLLTKPAEFWFADNFELHSWEIDKIAQTFRHGPHRKQSLSQLRNTVMFALDIIAYYCCLFRGRCLETNVVSESFVSNGCFSGSAVGDLRK
jgi:hypothetical protein